MRHPPLRLSRLLSSTASQQVMETKAKLEMDLTRKIGVNSKTIAIMKKMIKNLMLVAVAAMGFTACNDSIEEATRPIEPAEVKMTITADVDETRTWIDEANSKVQWSEGDALKVIENGATYRTTTETTIENDKAKFTVSFPANTDATEFTYNAIYPVSRVTEDGADKMDMTKIKVTLPDAQSPTATSFDPTADILVAKQIVTNTQPTELSMQFKRLVAMGKMTLTNLPESSTISKVIFTVEGAKENPDIAGRNYVDATTGTVQQYGYYGATNAITLNYNEPISTRDIYFTCNPFELVAGDKFTVKVVCSDATYTREVTLPEDKTLGFIEGDLSKFSVNMAGATKESNFVFPDGEYAAIAVVSNKYYALSSVANGKRLNAVEVTYTPGEGLTTDDTTLKWTVAKTDNGYTFKGSNNQYIAWSSDNTANTQVDVYYLDITEDAENAGRYVVTSKVDAARKLQKNTSNAYFAFYTTAQSGSLYLAPVTISETTEPEPVVKATIAEFLAAAEDTTVYELTGQITSVENTTYGNFYMKDETGEVLVYGLDLGESGVTWAGGDNLNVGDTITIKGVRSSYNGTAQVGEGVYVSHINGEAPVVVAKKVTVAEFLAAAEDNSTMYELTGTITSVVNTTYGNFDLTDDTGTVYIYGLCSPEGTQKYWAESGAKLGDDITIQTIRTSFQNSPQGKNAIFVELVSPGTQAFWTFSKTSTGFSVDGGSDTIDVTLYNFNDTVTATSNNVQFTATYANGVLTITAAENTSSAGINGIITVKAGDLTQDIAVTQSGVAAGESTWTLLKGNTLQAGDQIVIVAKDYNYAMSTTQNGNNRASKEITKTGDQLEIDNSVQILTVQEGTIAGSYALYTGTGYLYAASSSKNYLRTETTLSANSSWDISIATNGNATIKSKGTNTRNWLRFNNTNSPKIFSCYGSGQTDVVIYKLTNN